MLPDEMIEALVAAVLAVNNWSVEKVWALLPGLRQAGLLDPGQVVGRDLGELTVRLAAAGYDRGMLTSLLAGRLHDLLAVVARGGLDALPVLVHRKAEDDAKALLLSVKGIGPRVAGAAWMLVTS